MNDHAARLAEERAQLRPQGIAAEAEVLELLHKYSIAVIGGHARVVCWTDTTLHTMRLEALRTLLAGRVYVTRTMDGEKRVPLARYVLDHAQKYTGVLYAPGQAPVVGNRLNLWRGFSVDPVEGIWQLMEAHIRDVLADGNDEHARYILHWLAWCVQNPGQPAEVALVLRGGKGAGKGVLGNAMLRIFGPHGRHISNRKHLVSGFNQSLLHCSFLFADEAYWPGDQSAESELKRLITEPTLTIEPKGVDSFEAPNCLHPLITGNDDWVVPMSDDERRYAAFGVSADHVGDVPYFEALHAELSNGGLAAMLHDLLAMPLKGWHPRLGIPMTATMRSQQEQSQRGVPALIAALLEEGRLPAPMHGRPNVCLTADGEWGDGLWSYARRTIPSLRHAPPKVLSSALRTSWQCVRCKSAGQRGMEFLPLPTIRQLYVARYGPQDWDMTEDWS
jgi:Family of unknown function (DUF5906)